MPDVKITLIRRGFSASILPVLAFFLTACAPTSVPVRETKPTLQEQKLAKAVFGETNKLRINPRSYAEIMQKRRGGYRGKTYYPPGSNVGIVTSEGVRALDEAIAGLRKQKPLKPLRWSDTLAEVARAHVDDTGPSGLIGHNASNGDDFSARVAGVMKAANIRASGENIAYGLDRGQEVLVHLFVDDGVAGRGHRKNILSSEFNSSGVACGYHKQYETMCVVVFGDIR